MKVKLKDIALKAGVSSTTCSLILNNRPINVSDETKKNVLKVAQEMGYTSKQKIRNFGLIIPDLGNLYYTELIKHVSRTAQNFGYNLIISGSNNNIDQEILNIQQLIQSRVDGILISLVPHRTDPIPLFTLLRRVSDNNIPIVIMDCSLNTLGCCSVDVDDYYGGYLATEHLISLGHKKIGCISGNIGSVLSPQNRLTGFEAALAEHNIPYDDSLVIHGDYTVECGYKYAPVLLERGATAIFAHNDMIALGVYHYLRENHVRVPDEISLIGFDDVPIISSMELPLTTIAQPIQTLAERSIEILMEAIQTPSQEKVSITLRPELIVRATTGPCPAGK